MQRSSLGALGTGNWRFLSPSFRSSTARLNARHSHHPSRHAAERLRSSSLCQMVTLQLERW